MPAEFIEIVHPGQEPDAVRAMVVIIDRAGVAHAWDVEPVTSTNWSLIGLEGGRSKVRVTIEGAMHRRSKQIAATFLEGLNE